MKKEIEQYLEGQEDLPLEKLQQMKTAHAERAAKVPTVVNKLSRDLFGIKQADEMEVDASSDANNDSKRLLLSYLALLIYFQSYTEIFIICSRAITNQRRKSQTLLWILCMRTC